MYNNPYINTFNNQSNIDRINNQIAELEKMKAQIPMQQPTNLTQNFQIAPTNHNVMRYAKSMEEVEKNSVMTDTPFFSNDMSVVWIKNNKGEIKIYELTEIIPKDEKDLMIESLQMQINEMKGMIENAKSNNEYVDDTIKNEKSSSIPTISKSTTKSKQSSRNTK